jgi:Leucine-rich repeat (LRR) protein
MTCDISTVYLQMLPEACVIDDVTSSNGGCQTDVDSTLTKRRSFGDQYLLFVRQNTRDFMESNFPPGRESLRHMIIIQDDAFPPLPDILHRIDYSQLTSLYIVDCCVCLGDADAEVLRHLPLTSLVLSHTRLRRLPRAIFQLGDLEVLKVDRNCLADIPSDIGALKRLKCFVCDSQNPRLRHLPAAIAQLQQLTELSFSNNRVDNIAWVVHLPRLRVLRFADNKVTRLPAGLVNLRDLVTLDCAHNRLEYIPAAFTDLIRRLYSFHYHNLTLQPRNVRRDKNLLLSALELDNFLVQSPARRATVRDVSVGIVGESRSGKSSLVEALKADKGLCKMDARTGSGRGGGRR